MSLRYRKPSRDPALAGVGGRPGAVLLRDGRRSLRPLTLLESERDLLSREDYFPGRYGNRIMSP